MLAHVATQVGDKVRVKSGDHRGIRATVRSIRGKNLELWSEDLGITFRVPEQSVTNYSLAARKAWQTSPILSVGRPKRTGLSPRVSVTLRIDRDLMQRLRVNESAGIIEDRTDTINRWIREMLDLLDGRRA